MKKCIYCGKEHPDDATVCELDGQPLVDLGAPAPPMSRSGKEYKRLPGRGTTVEGAFTRSLSTVWMGRDHLLLVTRNGYTESYKRFYFRDIQAVIIRKNAHKTAFWNSVLMIVALVCFMIAFLVPSAGSAARIVFSLIGGAFLFFALVSLWLGAICVTHIKTAVQTEQLGAWSRTRAARKGMAIIAPKVREAQGEFAPDELKARLEEQILRQTQKAAPQTT